MAVLYSLLVIAYVALGIVNYGVGQKGLAKVEFFTALVWFLLTIVTWGKII